MEEVEEVVKLSRNVKTDVESNLELRLRIESLLDRKSTCKRCCFQGLSSDQRQTEYVDVMNRSWDTVEKWSREMSKYDYVFPGWWDFLTSSWADGSFCSQLHVPRDRGRSRSSKTTHNSGGSSHYRQFARAVLTGMCSIRASLSTPGGTSLMLPCRSSRSRKVQTLLPGATCEA